MCELVCDENWVCWIECTDYQARSSGIAKFVIGRWDATIKEGSVQPPSGWEYRLVPNNPNHGNELHLIPPEPKTAHFRETFRFDSDDKNVEAFQWRTEEAGTRLLKEQGHIKLKKSY
jgi:hypothetical protein